MECVMKIKLIAIDLDGTLLNSDHKLSNRVKDIISQAAKKKH